MEMILLHAIIHNKKAPNTMKDASIFEDNVTSTFFGPLCFLPNQDVVRIIKCVFPTFEEENVSHCDHIHFDFWRRLTPKEGSARKGKSIEPDLLVHFSSGSTAKQSDLTLLIEVKWLGYKDEHDKHQVHEQIDAIQTRLAPKHLQAIYLTQYEDVNKNPDKEYEGVSIDCVKWNEIASNLQDKLPHVSFGTEHWQKSALQYLERMLSNVFQGFSHNRFGNVPKLNKGPLYFSPFQGFSIPTILDRPTKYFQGENNE